MGRAPSNHIAVMQTTGTHRAEQGEQVFLLFYSPDDSHSMAEAVHALYYLPKNYELVILSDKFVQDGNIMPWADKDIMSRIHFENRTGLSSKEKTTPFLYLSSGGVKKSVFERALEAPEASDSKRKLRAADNNPEALATAILRLSRTFA